MFYRLLLAILLVSNIALAGELQLTRPERVGVSSERLSDMREHLQRLIDNGTFAGFQVVVARNGKIVMHENFGLSDVTGNDPIDDDSLFRIFSMTKPIVATAMMILFEEGKYSLQDPIAKFIPEFADLKVFAGLDDDGNVRTEAPVRPPTVHDLFQHTAGFTYGIFGDTPVDQLYRESEVLNARGTLVEFIGKLATLPLLHQPGTAYHYSVASDIQGYLIEVLSGMPAEQFIRARIFEPLNMDETVSWVPPERADRLATIHTYDENGKLVVYDEPSSNTRLSELALREPTAFSGGGQLVSTGDDYWRFAQMLANEGELDNERILSPLTVRLMMSNRLPDTIPNRRLSPGWGYGFNLGVVADATLTAYPTSNGEVRHGGLATTVFTVDPKENLVIVFLSQHLPTTNEKVDDLLHRLVRAAIIE